MIYELFEWAAIIFLGEDPLCSKIFNENVQSFDLLLKYSAKFWVFHQKNIRVFTSFTRFTPQPIFAPIISHDILLSFASCSYNNLGACQKRGTWSRTTLAKSNNKN